MLLHIGGLILILLLLHQSGLFSASLLVKSARHPAEIIHGSARMQLQVHYHNISNEALAELLRKQGYHVEEFPGRPPLVMIGDVAYDPQQVLPELAQARWTTMPKNNKSLWIEDLAKVWWINDPASEAIDEELTQKAMKTWSDNTCIRFVKMEREEFGVENDACDHSKQQEHGVVCIGDYGGGCWAQPRKPFQPGELAQKMSISTRCELWAVVHVLGHIIGNIHQHGRPDRDQFLFTKYENIEVPLDFKNRSKRDWEEVRRCNKDQILNLPLPYDYSSVMQYDTSSFSDADYRPILVTKDPHFQYQLDYYRSAGILQSYYDLYSANTVYSCQRQWIKQCEENYTTPPKCKNQGYAAKDCKCHCPPTHTGTQCESKLGPLFPLEPKVNMLEVTQPQLVDFSQFSMSMGKGNALLDEFKRYQFVTIIARGPNKTRTTIDTQPPKLPDTYTTGSAQEKLIESLQVRDCLLGVMLLWGVSSEGKHRRECVSTMNSNEPSGPMFRGKTNHLDMIFHSTAGLNPRETIMLMQFKMQFIFEKSANESLKTLHDASAKVGNDTLGAAMKATRMNKRNSIIIIAVISGVVSLIGTIFFCLNLRHSGEAGTDEDMVAEPEVEAEAEDNDTDSSSEESSSD